MTSLAPKGVFGHSIRTGHRHGMTEGLAQRLIDAIPDHPTLKTVCASQGVSIDSLKHWIRSGTLHGADPLLQRFAVRFIQADAAHAKELFTKFKDLAEERGKSSGAAQILKYIGVRWRHSDLDIDLMDVVQGTEKKVVNIEELLASPTPRLAAILDKYGWKRDPEWTPNVPIEAVATEVANGDGD